MPSSRSATAASRTGAASTRRSSRVAGPGRSSRVAGPGRSSREAGPRRLIPLRRPTRARVRWERVGRVALVIVLGVVAALYAQHAISYVSARSQYNGQTAIEHQLERDNAALVEQQRQLRDPATIVLDARRLGMVKPGERPFVITGLPAH